MMSPGELALECYVDGCDLDRTRYGAYCRQHYGITERPERCLRPLRCYCSRCAPVYLGPKITPDVVRLVAAYHARRARERDTLQTPTENQMRERFRSWNASQT